jgi:hypothetical protein
VQSRPDDQIVDALSDSASRPTTTDCRSARLGGLLVALVIAVQVAVPTVALLLPPPQRFGFQMYSGIGGIGVTVIDSGGDETAFDDAMQLVGELRPEIDWLPTLPEAVCDAVPDAVQVRVEQTDRKRTVECD